MLGGTGCGRHGLLRLRSAAFKEIGERSEHFKDNRHEQSRCCQEEIAHCHGRCRFDVDWAS